MATVGQLTADKKALDPRTIVENEEAIYNITQAYVGLIIYNKENGKLYKVTEINPLSGKIINKVILPPSSIGAQPEINSSNKLSADSIVDGVTNKVVTQTEKDNWNNKVNAESGKGLSTNDYNNIEKAKVANAIQTPDATENGKIPVMRDGNIEWENKPVDGQDGQRGPQGEPAVNPFKGWFDNLISLQTITPVIGDYGYVKGATTTDPVKIYECTTAGTWSYSGREVDTSNVQTFGTGQPLNEVKIDNTKLANPANNSLPKAADVMQLAAKLEGVTRVADKVALIDNSTFFDGKYVKNDKTIQSSTAPTDGVPNGIIIVNVEGYDKVIFLGFAKDAATTAGYGFSANAIDPTSTAVQLDMATAFRDGEAQPMADEYVVDVPEGMNWFACTVYKYGTPQTAVMTRDDFYCYKINGNLTLTTTDVDDTPQPYSNKVVKSGGLYDALYSKINVDLSTLPQYQTFINIGENVWVSGGTTYKSVMLQVAPGEDYYIKASNYTVFYALLKTSDHTAGTVPNYATGESIKQISPKHVGQIDVPEDAHFMYILVANGGNDVTPESFFKIGKSCNERIDDLENTTKELYVSNPFTMTGVGMSGAVNGTPQGVYKRFKLEDGAKYILRVDLSTFVHDEIPTGYNIYSLLYSINGSTTYLFRTFKGSNTLVAECSFTAVEADYYSLTIRANDGQIVEFDLVKEETALVENSPKEKSTKLITSGGVYDALQGGSDIVSLNDPKKTKQYLRNLKRPSYTKDGRYDALPSPIVLLHFSDLHSDAVNLRRIVEYANTYSDYIDDVIGTGDIIRNEFTNSFDFWHDCGADSFLLSTGNHEYYLKTDASSTYYQNVTPLQVYNKFFAPYRSGWGDVVFPTDAAEAGKCYYYKDYINYSGSGDMPHGIRLIVLDNMANMNPSERPNTGVQAAWLEGVLADAKTNKLHVLCAIHIGTTLETLFETPFSSFRTTLNQDSGANLGTFAEFYSLRDKVEAFITAGGVFIGWIAGHRHADSVGMITGYNQMTIHVATASGGNYSSSDAGHGDTDALNTGHCWWLVPRGDDCDREDGTRGQDCFNIISIDTEKMMLRVFKVGSNVDRYGRRKDSLVYNYGTKELVYSDASAE